MRKKNLIWGFLILSTSAFAFDLEDYATTYRATRDAYLKAANEMKLATGPYKSARNAYQNATQDFIKSLGTGKAALDQSTLAKKRTTCVGLLFTDSAVGGEPQIILDEMTAREDYKKALADVEKFGKDYSASLMAYRRATNEYVHSLSLPLDTTMIKRNDIINGK